MSRKKSKKKGPTTMEIIDLVIKVLSLIIALIAALKS